MTSMNYTEDDDPNNKFAWFQFYDQRDFAWPKHIAIRGGNCPPQLEFSKQDGYNYLLQQNGENTKHPLVVAKRFTSGTVSKSFMTSFGGSKLTPESESVVHQINYSNKVHAIAWVTIALAIFGISLSAIGLALGNKSLGIMSAFSIAICGISLVIWIESARRKRNIH